MNSSTAQSVYPASPGSASAKWVIRPLPRPRANLLLFCFPYAGGDALSIFRRWPELFPPDIEICMVQLPGRGSRVLEPAYTNLLELVKTLGEVLQPELYKPFAFFGHSMGALISFELARLLRTEKIYTRHLCLSGRRGPSVRHSISYDLPEDEFLKELRRMNGTPKEALEHTELMQLMLPTLRADFQACQTYDYRPQPPLAAPISVFWGNEEEGTREEIESWKKETKGAFRVHFLPGDHFFIKHQEPHLVRLLRQDLQFC